MPAPCARHTKVNIVVAAETLQRETWCLLFLCLVEQVVQVLVIT